MALGILIRDVENPSTEERNMSMNAHPTAAKDNSKDILLRWRQALLLLFRFESFMAC
jgi:hypothetical protein